MFVQYAFPTSAPSISQAPTVWTPSIDIGDVQREGQYIPANPDTGIITVKGSGTGTWATQDSFFFHSEQRDADNLDIICYVNNWGWNWKCRFYRWIFRKYLESRVRCFSIIYKSNNLSQRRKFSDKHGFACNNSYKSSAANRRVFSHQPV